VLRDADALYAALDNSKGRAETAFALGELERAQFNNEPSRAAFDNAATLFRAAGDWGGEARALIGRADVERRLARILSAQRSAARAGAIYTVLRETQNANLARRTLEEVTTNYPDDNEELREAIRTEALQLEQAGDLPGEAMVVLRLAALEHTVGRPAQAREAYNRAIGLLRAEQQQAAGLVRALTGLGDLERGLEHADAAATAYTSARTLAQQLNDPAAEAALLVGLADIERARGGATAATLAQQARSQFQRANHAAGQASALVLQARIALLGNDIAAAERAVAEAQQVLGQSDDPVAGQIHLVAADVLRAKRDAGAVDAYRAALAAFEANGVRLGEAWALLGLGQAQGAASPIEAKVNLLLAGNQFAALGMEARRAEATAAAAAIN
jgi:tetratricopeptide (TPR) repeat protein